MLKSQRESASLKARYAKQQLQQPRAELSCMTTSWLNETIPCGLGSSASEEQEHSVAATITVSDVTHSKKSVQIQTNVEVIDVEDMLWQPLSAEAALDYSNTFTRTPNTPLKSSLKKPTWKPVNPLA